MKKTILLIFLSLCLAKVSAQQPYSLPFYESHANIVSGTAYDNSTLNTTLSTSTWEYSQPTSVAGITRFSYKTISEGGYLVTPQISVPAGSALEINFVARMVQNDIGSTTADKKTNNLQRNFYAVIGNDTVYDHQKISYDMSNPLMQNFNRFMATYIYDGQSPVTVKFFSTNTYQGVWAAKLNTDGMTFGNGASPQNSGTLIQVRSGVGDTIPAINIAYGENIDLGEIALSQHASGTVVSKEFPLKGKNLANSVEMNDDASSSIKLPVKSFIPSGGVVNQNVALNVTMPAISGTYVEKVNVVADGDRASGLTNTAKSPTRTIWFKYTVVDVPTKLSEVASDIKVSVLDGKINIASLQPVGVKVFSVGGVLLKESPATTSECYELPKGIYMLKVGSEIKKIKL